MLRNAYTLQKPCPSYLRYLQKIMGKGVNIAKNCVQLQDIELQCVMKHLPKVSNKDCAKNGKEALFRLKRGTFWCKKQYFRT